MRTLTHIEIENVALKVAAILKDKADGDPADPDTWKDAARGICGLMVRYDWHGEEYGGCLIEPGCDSPNNVRAVIACGSYQRPAHLARVLIHELAHAVLHQYDALTFTDAPWEAIAYTYQAGENIARAVERYFLGSFGHGWLPTHGFYWS